jgi:transcriptional regulator with XRE-family HTH domain
MATIEKLGDSETRSEIGKRVAAARHARGISQIALADALVKPDGSKWHSTYVGQVERGAKAPSRDYLDAVAALCEVEVETLVPEGFSLDSLRQGIRNRRRRRAQRRNATLAASGSPAAPRPQPLEPDAEIGIRLVGEALTIEVGDSMTVSAKGAFKGTIVKGRLQLLS